MADLVNPSTYSMISGGGSEAPDPMKMLTQWQQLQNLQTNNQLGQQNIKNLQTENDTKQFDLGAKRREYAAKQIFAVANLPDGQLIDGAHATLDRERQAGLLDDKQYSAMKQQIDAAGGDPAKARPIVNSVLAGSLGGPEAIKFLYGDKMVLDNGGQLQGAVSGGLGGQNPGAVTGSGAVYTKLPGPTYMDLGRSVQPLAGGGQPLGGAMQKTSLEDIGGQIQPVTGISPVGGSLTKTAGPGQTAGRTDIVGSDGKVHNVSNAELMNPSLLPPDVRKNLQGPLSGRYPTPGAGGTEVTTAAGMKQKQETDVDSFTKDQQQMPDRMQNSQNLHKALDALRTVNTGSGNEWISGARAKAVTLMRDIGISNPRMDAADFSQAEADKLLTDYARKSGSAANSNNQLAASEASNPSTHINNAAAQDFVKNNIGLERQKAAAVMLQQKNDKNGVGYNGSLVDFASKTDKRGFAIDAYTPKEVTEMVSHMSPEQREKFWRAAGMARQLGLATGEQGSPNPAQNAAAAKAMGQ